MDTQSFSLSAHLAKRKLPQEDVLDGLYHAIPAVYFFDVVEPIDLHIQTRLACLADLMFAWLRAGW